MDSLAAQIEYPGIPSLIVSFACGLLQSLILIRFLIQTRGQKMRPYFHIAYLSMICFILYSIGLFSLSLISIIPSPTQSSFTSSLCTLLFLLPWLYKTGEISMYLFYLCRLYNIFCDTSFEYKKPGLVVFSIFIIFGFFIENSILSIYIIISKPFHGVTTITECIDAGIALDQSHLLLESSFFIALFVETFTAIWLLRYVLYTR